MLPDVAACVACGKLDPGPVTHRRCGFEEAGEAMTDPGPKLIFLREGVENLSQGSFALPSFTS